MICKSHFPCALWALTCLLAVSLSPARALTESQQDAAITSLQSTVVNQQATISALMAKLQYVTASGHDLTLTGILHVVSGSGHTNAAPNGLGNVIIGYNESRGSNGTDTRTGSHNLILGSLNNYSSYGGIIAGVNNSSSSGYASVTGGKNNMASGFFCTVSGGYGNTAGGNYSSVGGGYNNATSGTYAFLPLDADLTTIDSKLSSQAVSIHSLQTSVTSATKITGLFALSSDKTRSDLKANTELTLTAVNLHIVNGLGATNGEPNNPTDTGTPVTNGLGNLIIGYNEARTNGFVNTRTGSHNLILGDFEEYSSYGGIVAGYFNTISAPFASVSGGEDNTASGYVSSVSGGVSNTAGGVSSRDDGGGASISGGSGNMASGRYSSISGGVGNITYGFGTSISGGAANAVSGTCSSVSGGAENAADGTGASVSGGESNTATGDYSSVSGGGYIHQTTEDEWAAGSLHSP